MIIFFLFLFPFSPLFVGEEGRRGEGKEFGQDHSPTHRPSPLREKVSATVSNKK